MKVQRVAAVLAVVLEGCKGAWTLGSGQELIRVQGVDGVATEIGILVPLAADATFEVRVSYLSTTPADFSMQVRDGGGGRREPSESSGRYSDVSEEKEELRRRRLNTERFRISTDSQGNVVLPDGSSTIKPILLVTPTLTGVRSPAHGDRESEILFNIALDQLIGGVLPGSALHMIAWGLVSVITARLCLVPFLQRQLASLNTSR
mmetsp:Transcript_16231/g.28778  ORF Transcript_16231/g.28778 Transcript_16231/m.28778 type:complete len:205 (-) Transcript_16231:104-718(-)